MQSNTARQVLKSVSWDWLVSYTAFLDLAWPQIKPETSSKVVGRDIGAWCVCMGGYCLGLLNRPKAAYQVVDSVFSGLSRIYLTSNRAVNL